MGVKKTRSGGNYLKVADGRFRLGSFEDDKEATARTISRDGEADRVVYERVFDEVDGFIKSIYKKEHDDYGIQYSIRVVDADGEAYSIQCNEESRYFETVAQILPEVDLDKPVLFKAYSMPIDGKSYKNVGLSIYQEDKDGKWVKVPNHFKDYNEKKNKSILKNGMEKYDFSKVESKKGRKKLKLDLLEFLGNTLDPIIEDLKSRNADEEAEGKGKDKKSKAKSEKKPAEKKPAEKKPAEKKPAEKKPAKKKSKKKEK